MKGVDMRRVEAEVGYLIRKAIRGAFERLLAELKDRRAQGYEVIELDDMISALERILRRRARV